MQANGRCSFILLPSTENIRTVIRPVVHKQKGEAPLLNKEPILNLSDIINIKMLVSDGYELMYFHSSIKNYTTEKFKTEHVIENQFKFSGSIETVR